MVKMYDSPGCEPFELQSALDWTKKKEEEIEKEEESTEEYTPNISFVKIAIQVVGIGIVIAVGMMVLTEVQSAVNTTYSGTNETFAIQVVSAINSVNSFLPILIIVGIVIMTFQMIKIYIY